MSSQKYRPPYQTLGKYLKTMRQKLQETLGETSGAVEIDVAMLDKIERGEHLPSEDILLLLISHFGLQDDEAVELWQLAGYDQPELKTPHHDHGHHAAKQTAVMMMVLDNRVLYSNKADIISDEAGITLSFSQTLDAHQASLPVARVGMSYQQAEKVLILLQRTLLRRQLMNHPKLLNSGVPDPTIDKPDVEAPLRPETPPQPGKPDESQQDS